MNERLMTRAEIMAFPGIPVADKGDENWRRYIPVLLATQDAKSTAWFVAQARVLVEALRGVEWLVEGSTFFCPGCLRTKGDGHDKDCKMHLAFTSPLALLAQEVTA